MKIILFITVFFLSFNTLISQEFASAHEINNRLGKGINMGNSFEAPSETAWGNQWKPQYFRIMAEQGFSHVRIPIRWSTPQRTMDEFPYTIYPAFMERIQQVVDTALKYKLHPIINMHHHEDLLADLDGKREKFLAQWNQISEHFKDYPDSLLFEVFNEPHNSIDPPKWNILFREALDQIRTSNPKRTVLIGTAPWGGLDGVANLDWPDDEYLILTVHYYNPFTFTHQGASWVGENANEWLGTEWNDTQVERETIMSEFAYTKEFAQQHNIPVNVGEFGAYSTADIDSRVRWTTFLARWFEQQGFSWTYWEFSAGFGIYNPNNGQLLTPLADALLRNPMPEPIGYIVVPVYQHDFINGSTGWNLNTSGQASANMAATDGKLNINITKAGADAWNIQLVKNNIRIEKDQMYRVTFKAKADQTRSVTSYIGKNSSPWNAYSGYLGHALTAQETIYSYSFVMTSETDNSARFTMDLGTSDTNISLFSFSIDKINLLTSLDKSSFEKIKVYPNPITNRLNIESKGNFDFATIYDSSGRIIKSHWVDPISTSINTENLNAGLYILRLTGQQYPISFKLIKH
jgi:endoglucanase